MSDQAETCRWCGEQVGTDQHGKVLCPQVKALEFDAAGNVTRVEFIVPADFGPNRVEHVEEQPRGDYPRYKPAQ